MLDEDVFPPTQTRRENPNDSLSNPYDDSRSGVGK
jgi:hypothetical protein